MGTWAKLSPFNLPTRALFELRYQCGRTYGKLCYPPPKQSLLTKQEDDSGALDSAKKVEEETEEVDDDKYVPPDGQGCFSFRQSLLLRAKDTYAARSIGNKYEIISRWLLTGLAVVLSRPNWPLLAKKGTLTSTPQELLQKYYQGGYPAGLKDRVELPYALPKHNAITEAEWCRRVGLFCHSQYLQDMEVLYTERTGSAFEAFYGSMDHTNPIQATECDQIEEEQKEPPARTGQSEPMQ